MLRYYSNAAFGKPPGVYHRQRRLQLARAALLAADPAETTVTSIALAYGFSEFGRFAQHYVASFDELPSTTLRRS